MGQQGTFWTVDPGDTIYSIATKLNFMDGGQALWNANPDIQTKSNNNPDVLSPGWVLKIPQTDPKTEGGMPVAQQHQFQLPGSHRKLILNLRDQNGNKLQGWQYRFQVQSIMKESGDIGDAPIDIDFDADSLQEETLSDVVLQAMKGQLSDPNSVMDSIQLTVGGLDPIIDGLPGRIAIQKILTNLGYFQGQVDGNFGIDTVAAIANFQNVNHLTVDGSASAETCQALVSALGNIIGVTPPTDPQSPSDPRDRPLGTGTEATISTVGGRTLGNTYLEPPAKDATDKKTRLPMGMLRYFPPAAYVAPCDKSTADDGRNIIQMPLRRFVFLDTGRWYNDGRDFGLIWGRHVYLCSYVPSQSSDPSQNQNSDPGQNTDPNQNSDPGQNQNSDPGQNSDPSQNQNSDPGQSSEPGQNSSSGQRLDQTFFTAMGASVNVVTYACVNWAPATDFDWDTLYLIVPDVHLMDGPTAAIWHEKHPYDLKTELDLLDFVKKVISIDALKANLMPMQIGDYYDLWVGGAYHGTTDPLFQQNALCQMRLVGEDNGDGNTDPGATSAACSLLTDWIQEIQGVKTPWVSGLLQDKRAQIFWAQYNCTQLENFIDEPDGTIAEVAKRIRDGIIPQYKFVEDLSQNSTFSGAYPWMFSDSTDGSLDPQNVHEGLDALQQYVQQAMTQAGDPSALETDLFDGTNWLNPSEKAFRLLADTFSAKGMVYFYGNHDNYLLNDALCGQAGIPTRDPFREFPGCLIEHVHRLEATFSALAFGGGNNFDGEQSGYRLTNERWDGLNKPIGDYLTQSGKDFSSGQIFAGFWSGLVGLFSYARDKAIASVGVSVADWFAGLHDQKAYAEEYVDLWLGRFANASGGAPASNGAGQPTAPPQDTDPTQGADPSQGGGAPGGGAPSGGGKPPHIFVIGHTHMPKLMYITIDSTPSTLIGDIANA